MPLAIAKRLVRIALKFREVAENHEIPIVEDQPLARSLYESAAVEKLMPAQLRSCSCDDLLPACEENSDAARRIEDLTNAEAMWAR